MIGGDANAEDLDPMMNGQSHRARLNDEVKKSGGQDYSRKAGPLDNRSRGANPRGLKRLGRGGGIVGSRGRSVPHNSSL